MLKIEALFDPRLLKDWNEFRHTLDDDTDTEPEGYSWEEDFSNDDVISAWAVSSYTAFFDACEVCGVGMEPYRFEDYHSNKEACLECIYRPY